MRVGKVFYGNVGRRERLDFTVIEPAVPGAFQDRSRGVNDNPAWSFLGERKPITGVAFDSPRGGGRGRKVADASGGYARPAKIAHFAWLRTRALALVFGVHVVSNNLVEIAVVLIVVLNKDWLMDVVVFDFGHDNGPVLIVGRVGILKRHKLGVIDGLLCLALRLGLTFAANFFCAAMTVIVTARRAIGVPLQSNSSFKYQGGTCGTLHDLGSGCIVLGGAANADNAVRADLR
jgi:hypothetical protein